MNDNSQDMTVAQEEAETAPVQEAPPPALQIGRTLREAREARSITVVEAAQAIKLSRSQIEAMENEEWSRLPEAMFLRGFLRNYARLLKVDGEALVAAYNVGTVVEAPPAPAIELPQPTEVALPSVGEEQRKSRTLFMAAAGMLMAAILIFVLVPHNFWSTWRASAAAPADKKAMLVEPSPQVVQPEPVSAAPASAPDSVPSAQAAAAAALPTAPEMPAAPSAAPAAAAPVTMPASAPAAASAQPVSQSPAPAMRGNRQLRFRFSGDSWVEVRDRNGLGQILFSQLNRAGSEQVVAGDAPLAIVIGNASHVRVEINGRSLDLAPHTKVEVARLTVE